MLSPDVLIMRDEMETQRLTLTELQAETLMQKNRRMIQEKCAHEEVYSSSIWCRASGKTFTNRLCLDCHKSWHSEMETQRNRF